MFIKKCFKKCFAHKAYLLIITVFILLHGCSLITVAKGTPADMPDSVQIKTNSVLPDVDKVMTSTDVNLIHQLYQRVYTLPQMPDNLACTREFGPRYTLTFRQKGRTLGTAQAERYGCRPVTIFGEQHDRQATAAFWTLLDQIIANGRMSGFTGS
jgi:hypothetical protein